MELIITDMLAFDDDLVTILVGKANLDLVTATRARWALEVITNQLKFGTVRVLGHTENWINSCEVGTLLKYEVATNILPVHVILIYFNDGFASVISW